MRLPDSMLAPLEIGLNRYLADDPVALSSLADLKDRVIALRLREFDLQFFMRLHGGGVQVMAECEGEPDARIETSGPALARAFLQPDSQQELTLSGGIDVDGNVELVQDFLAILRNTDFDPEEWLAQRIGDVAAYRAGQFLRGVLDFGRSGLENLMQGSNRYLREETGDLVEREETRQWMNDVDDLRSAVDRVEARIQRLNSQLHQQEKA